MNYADKIASFLDSEEIVVYNREGANFFTHPIIEPNDFIPEKSAFIFAPTGGSRPAISFDNTEIRYPVFQIIVRGNVNQYLEGEEFSNDIYNALEKAEISNFIDVRCQQSGPVWIGYDEGNRPRWVINVELLVEREY